MLKSLGGLSLVCALSFPAGAGLAQEGKRHSATVDADGVQRVRIVGGSYFFEPSHIVVKVDTPVELSLTRESGITPHDLVIRAPEAGVVVEAELHTDVRKISFKPTTPGKYAIYCSKKLLFFASHRERGMEGILEVVP